MEYAREYIRRFHLKPAPQPVPLEHWPWPLKVCTSGGFYYLSGRAIPPLPRKAQKKPLGPASGPDRRREKRHPGGGPGRCPLAGCRRGCRRPVPKDHPPPVAHPRGPGRGGQSPRRAGDPGRELSAGSMPGPFEQLLEEADRRNPQGRFLLTGKGRQFIPGPFSWAGRWRSPGCCRSGKGCAAVLCAGWRNWAPFGVEAGSGRRPGSATGKGLEVDGLAEEFCQGSMVCCQHLGLKAEGLSPIQRFEKRLKTELGIEPAAKTRVIRDSLLVGAP